MKPSEWILVLIFLFLCLNHRPCSSRAKPSIASWGNEGNMDKRMELFLNWLILGCAKITDCEVTPSQPTHVEYPGYDGFFNNIARPSQGGIDTPLLRLLPPVYEDGVYEPVRRKANPLNVSDMLMNGSSGETSKSGNTALLLFFGQQVVEEILDSQGSACPPEYFNIQIPKGHEYQITNPKVSELPLLRTRYDMSTGFSPNNPRQQLNEITPYIDGGLVYGSSKGWADLLRLKEDGTVTKGGKLASHSELGEQFPAANSHRMPFANPPPPTNHSQFVKRGYTADVDRFIKLGNPRGNENPFLLTFGIFWFRWHNTIASFLQKHYNWEGEKIFNEARKWVIATQQAVTVYDWLPKYLKTNLKQYNSPPDKNERKQGGYNPAVDPQISHVFQSAAMRFGHTLVPSGVYLRKKESEGCGTVSSNLDFNAHSHSAGVRTCNSFWRSPEFFTKQPKNFERFLMGMSSQLTEKEDNIIVEDLRGRVFGPLEFSRRDLMAINIQRGRDHGLPDYNTARNYFDLPTLKDLSPEEYKAKTGTLVDDEVLARLKTVYDNPSEVDIWPGGLLETKDGPGQLFTAVIKDQFERIRAADRFWFENEKNKLFKPKEIQRIRDIKIIDMILCISDITLQDIQEDPFTAPRQNNLPGGGKCRSELKERKTCKLYQPQNDSWSQPISCQYLPPLKRGNLENCTKPQTYDYFEGSRDSFIITFAVVGVAIVGILTGINVWEFLQEKKHRMDVLSRIQIKEGEFKCKGLFYYKSAEKVSFLERRVVIISFDSDNMQILVKSNIDKVLRVMELSHLQSVSVFHTEDLKTLIIRAENHYDLYLTVNETFYSQQLLTKLEGFCESAGKVVFKVLKTSTQINDEAITFKHREEQLRKVIDSVLNTKNVKLSKHSGHFQTMKHDVSKIQLTKMELANALGMTTDNNFFKQFFYLMDKDKNGFVTFQEFMSVVMMYSNGTNEEKAHLFFNIYDLDHSGTLTTEDFREFIGSTKCSEMGSQANDQIVASIWEMFGLQPDDKMSFEEFHKIFVKSNQMYWDFGPMLGEKEKVCKQASNFSLYGDLYEPEDQENYENIETEEAEQPLSQVHLVFSRLTKYVKSNEKLLFWMCLYTAVMILVFAERAYYYSVEREHAGLRRIAGYGVTVTRGAASAIMFTYSSLLVTMCRNILSFLRASFVHKYFPFDEMVDIHKYIGWWALVWTLIHVIGHAINFYHISTQTSSDLLCLFRNFYRATHVLPKFHYWCWETVTGLTGVFLTIQVAIIYIFVVQAKRKFYKFFWLTHNTYPLLYFLIILHGSGQLVQPPFFHFFFVGPAILFALDKIVSTSRKNIKIQVLGSKHLPSNVTLLRIRRPNNFSYHSGQWVRIASDGISKKEFHPFTISSAPNEKDLTLHIRGVGPWTNRIRKVYPDFEAVKPIPNFTYPEVFIDGPFGEGHQMWWNYEVVVFVGGGIGVTPFASILKDIVFKCKQPVSTFKCKRVIFLWVTRSQKQFEWVTDILRQVEEADTKNIIKIHIFITQFKSKYDFRTTMLYHAERHFQKVSGTSMFTGLRALTHFSRPDFTKVFKTIKKNYSEAPIIAVFTCGSLALSSSVDAGCRSANRGKDPVLKHYYENF